MMHASFRPRHRYRTLFLSDFHLGTRGCQAEMLLTFLEAHDADRIFLVGDIFDGWRLRRGVHWPQAHDDVVHALMTKAHDGAQIIYIPGNHDEVARKYQGTHFAGIELRDRDLHITADGRRLLVMHGDEFDLVVRNAKWLARVGDTAYGMVLAVNTTLNRMRHLWGGQYWSLSNWSKQQVKQAVNFIGEFETVLSEEARRHHADGIVCGHIHKAELRQAGDILYANCGDWVESCTALVEHTDGRMELIDWARQGDTRPVRARARLPQDGMLQSHH